MARFSKWFLFSILYLELSATSFDNAMPTIDIAGPNHMSYSDNLIIFRLSNCFKLIFLKFSMYMDGYIGFALSL